MSVASWTLHSNAALTPYSAVLSVFVSEVVVCLPALFSFPPLGLCLTCQTYKLGCWKSNLVKKAAGGKQKAREGDTDKGG